MTRAIVEYGLQGTKGSEDTDKYFDKIVKYVPADVIAAWTAAVAVIKGDRTLPEGVLPICFVLGLAATAWWTRRNFKPAVPQPSQVKTKQIVVAVVAFAVWALALGDLNDYLVTLSFWHQAYAKLLLIGFTLVSGAI